MPGMPAGEVLAVLDALAACGYQRVWLGGGWGVDALAGRQTRDHRDADLALDVTGQPGGADLTEAVTALAALGYTIETDWRPSRLELAAQGSRYVDLHPVVFAGSPTGRQANLADLPPFLYPPDGFARGVVDGRIVDCLSVEQQLRFHRGYPPRPQDLADLALLEKSAERPA
jgi:lincosamide nucleotidyltransferase A/C/D/E